jgi:LemA protein
MTVFIFLGIAAIFVFWAIAIYNGMIKSRNQVANAFAQIDVQLKRRYDLIPNLVETARAYLKHEKETLEAVINARNRAHSTEATLAKNATNPNAMRDFLGAEAQLGQSMGKLMVTVEAYPELKADLNMRALQEELTSTENRVGFARQAFNDFVTEYNNKREVFPNVVFANLFGFAKAEPFLITEASERNAPKVQFN